MYLPPPVSHIYLLLSPIFTSSCLPYLPPPVSHICLLLSPIFICSYLEVIVIEISILLQSILGYTSTVELSYRVMKGD